MHSEEEWSSKAEDGQQAVISQRSPGVWKVRGKMSSARIRDDGAFQDLHSYRLRAARPASTLM